MSADAPALTVEGVTFSRKRRGQEPLEVLADIDLSVRASSVTAIIGPNGCGKSTLLDIACGLLAPGSGRVVTQPIALMPQADTLMPWATALDNAALPLRSAGAGRAEARERAAQLFPRLGLSGFEQSRPHELSGGMRQRVAFARTLLIGRPVLALDEPFSALDSLTRVEARRWLADVLRDSLQTAIVVTHDVAEAIELADTIVVLSERPARVLDTFHVSDAVKADPAAAALLAEEILGRLIPR